MLRGRNFGMNMVGLFNLQYQLLQGDTERNSLTQNKFYSCRASNLVDFSPRI